MSDCGFNPSYKQHDVEITVGRIVIDEAAINRCNDEIEKMFKEHHDFFKDMTPEQIKEWEDKYSYIESMGR